MRIVAVIELTACDVVAIVRQHSHPWEVAVSTSPAFTHWPFCGVWRCFDSCLNPSAYAEFGSRSSRDAKNMHAR